MGLLFDQKKIDDFNDLTSQQKTLFTKTYKSIYITSIKAQKKSSGEKEDTSNEVNFIAKNLNEAENDDNYKDDDGGGS